MLKEKNLNKEKDLSAEIKNVVTEISKGVLAEVKPQIEEMIKKPKKKIGEKISKFFGEESIQKILNQKDTMKPEEKAFYYIQAVLQGNDELAKALNEEARKKALQEGVANYGAELVPNEFRAMIIRDIEEMYVMRSLVTVVPMRRKTLEIPKLGNRPKVYWTPEAKTKTTTTASFSTKYLYAYKAAAIQNVSDELIADAYDFDILRLLAQLFAEEIGDEEERVLTAGTGTNEPTGLTNCTISSVACSGNLSFENLINLEYALPAQYRRRIGRCSFLMNPNNVKELRKLRTDSGAGAGTGNFFWQEPIAAGQPVTFHGYQVVENSYVPESEIYFGDFKEAYWLGDRQQMSLETSRQADDAWKMDLTSIRVVFRIGGNCVLENAMRKLTNIP